MRHGSLAMRTARRSALGTHRPGQGRFGGSSVSADFNLQQLGQVGELGLGDAEDRQRLAAPHVTMAHARAGVVR